jgi:peptidoglycan/LPS O-acetylase OafA/YrhL
LEPRRSGAAEPRSVAIVNLKSSPASTRADGLPALTGIRGVAALGVFLCHFEDFALKALGIAPQHALLIFRNGFRGVDLFFILSGFILFHVHSREFSALRRTPILRFYVLRFFRVYPLNTAILLALLGVLVLPGYVDWHRQAHAAMGSYHLRDFSFGGFIQSLLLAQTWTFFKLGTWNEPAWTLSAEVLGYGLFPLLALYANWRLDWRPTALTAALSLTALAGLMFLLGHLTDNPSGLFGAARMIFCFFAGICLCRCAQLVSLPAEAARILTAASLAAVVLCLLIDALGVLTIFGFAGLIFGLSCQTGGVSALFTSRFSMWLGRISFSFYMVHTIPINLLDWAASSGNLSPLVRVLMLGSTPIVCLGLAVFTYHFVEVPFQRLGRVAAKAVVSNAPQHRAVDFSAFFARFRNIDAL